MNKISVLFCGALLLVACAASTLPPKGQLLVYVDTNGPVPLGNGRALTRDDPAPLFDTLRVEAFLPGETTPCAGCTREFSVDAARFTAKAISVGVPLKPGVSGYRLRVTLFLEALVVPCSLVPPDVRSQTEECIADPQAQVAHRATLIQTTTRLPVIASEGVQDVSVFLDVENVGQPVGTLDAPVDGTTAGAPKASQVGTWSGAQRVGCTSPQRPGEVCVPSGAFWMGNVRWAKQANTPISPRLVVLSPFYMKATEVTVGECLGVSDCAASVTATSSTLGASQCYLVASPNMPKRNERAVNCTLADARAAYCKAWGGDVASAAQIEYASRGTVSTVFVWGDDTPVCKDAMWGREFRYGGDGPCVNPSKRDAGPYVPGLGLRDRLELATGAIVDLAGNLQEMAADETPANCQCDWPERMLRDPVCKAPNPGGNTALGGAWSYGVGSLAPVEGGCYPTNYVSAVAGFRCTRADH